MWHPRAGDFRSRSRSRPPTSPVGRGSMLRGTCTRSPIRTTAWTSFLRGATRSRNHRASYRLLSADQDLAMQVLGILPNTTVTTDVVSAAMGECTGDRPAFTAARAHRTARMLDDLFELNLVEQPEDDATGFTASSTGSRAARRRRAGPSPQAGNRSPPACLRCAWRDGGGCDRLHRRGGPRPRDGQRGRHRHYRPRPVRRLSR